jgi:hypothetical protein
MPQITFASMRGIAHKGSGGMTSVFPDVCRTPTNGPLTVTVAGQMPLTKGEGKNARRPADPLLHNAQYITG